MAPVESGSKVAKNLLDWRLIRDDIMSVISIQGLADMKNAQLSLVAQTTVKLATRDEICDVIIPRGCQSVDQTLSVPMA